MPKPFGLMVVQHSNKLPLVLKRQYANPVSVEAISIFVNGFKMLGLVLGQYNLSMTKMVIPYISVINKLHEE